MVESEQHRLHIADLRFEAIVGILDSERMEPQELIVNANLEVDFDQAHHVGSKMDQGVDYARMVEFLTTRIQKGEFGLLEDLLDTVGRQAFESFPDLMAMELKVEKPNILETCRSVGASLYLKRTS